MAVFTQQQIDEYLKSRGEGTQTTEGQKLYPLMDEIAGLAQQGKFYNLAEVYNYPTQKSFYQTRQTQAEINQQSLANDLNARKARGEVLTADMINQNVAGLGGDLNAQDKTLIQQNLINQFSSSFGTPVVDTVGARQPNETMDAYLGRKQAAGVNVNNGGAILPAGQASPEQIANPANYQTTTKTTTPTANVKADQLQVALDRIAGGNPGTADQTNIDYAKSKGMLATLYSTKGEKKIVAVGSKTASQLLGQGWTLKPQATSGAITSENLKDTKPIDLSNTNTSSSSVPETSTIAASSATSKSINDYLKLIQGEETATQKKESDLETRLSDLIGQTAGQTQTYQEEFDKAGGKQFSENLKNINNEITIKTAALEKRLAEIGATPMTTLRAGGQEAQARRLAQSDIMFLQAQAQAAMNNLSFAKETAQAAVDAKYNPILEEIKIKQEQLKIIEGQVSKEETDYANALQLYLTDQENAVKEQKANEASINEIVMNVIANNPNISKDRIIDQIKNASTPVEAAQIAGALLSGTGYQYVQTPAELTQLKAQGYETVQIGGRTYARQGSGGSNATVDAYVQQIQSGAIKLTNVPAAIRNDVAVALSEGEIVTPVKSNNNKKELTPEEQMIAKLSKVVGPDGFVSPGDYLIARNAWVNEAGLSPTTFDTKFKGFRNPNNPNYVINKESNTSNNGRTP